MIIIHNIITFFKNSINNIIGCNNYKKIEFENNNKNITENNNDDKEICYCNLCYSFRNIILFTTKKLK